MSNGNPENPRPADDDGQDRARHPEYGQPSSSGEGYPAYGQPEPSYGQDGQPSYGEQPTYGQDGQPSYGEQPTYGQGQQPSYGQQDHGQQQYPAYGQQQPYGQQNSYQQAPYPQDPNAWGAGGPATMPREVNTGSWLIAAGGLLAMIYTAMQAAFIGSPQGQSTIEQALQQTGQNAQGFSTAELASAAQSVLLVGGVIALALYVLVVVFVRRGKNWARILGTVLAACSLLFVGINLGGLAMVVGIAGVVMLWLRPARPWFRKASAAAPWAR